MKKVKSATIARHALESVAPILGVCRSNPVLASALEEQVQDQLASVVCILDVCGRSDLSDWVDYTFMGPGGVTDITQAEMVQLDDRRAALIREENA